MADSDPRQETSGDDEEPAFQPARSFRDSDEIDMTPMIDCVFLLLIFFLVNSASSSINSGVELPPARHGVPADMNKALVITVLEGEGARTAEASPAQPLRGSASPAAASPRTHAASAYLDYGGPQQALLPEDVAACAKKLDDELDARRKLGQEVESVVLLAGKEVRHREVSRVGSVVGQLKATKLKLYLAVFDGK